MANDPIYLEENAVRFGLSPQEWDIAVDKFKTPFGRRVVVHVRCRATGETRKNTVVGSHLSKRDLDVHAQKLVSKLVRSMA